MRAMLKCTSNGSSQPKRHRKQRENHTSQTYVLYKIHVPRMRKHSAAYADRKKNIISALASIDQDPSYPDKHKRSTDLLGEQSRPRSDYKVHKLVQVHAARAYTHHKCIKLTFTLVTFSFLTVIYLIRHVLCMAKTTTHLIRERRRGRSAHRPTFTNNELRHPLYKAPLINDTFEMLRVSFHLFVHAKSIDLGQAMRCTGCSSPHLSQKCIGSVQIYFNTIIS